MTVCARQALWERRSPIGLLGSHIDVETGKWVYFDSGIGGGIDSFFEYLMKAHLLTGTISKSIDVVIRTFHGSWIFLTRASKNCILERF